MKRIKLIFLLIILLVSQYSFASIWDYLSVAQVEQPESEIKAGQWQLKYYLKKEESEACLFFNAPRLLITKLENQYCNHHQNILFEFTDKNLKDISFKIGAWEIIFRDKAIKLPILKALIVEVKEEERDLNVSHLINLDQPSTTLCVAYNDQCELIIENTCGVCPFGSTKVEGSSCPKFYNKICGVARCGQRNQPACLRGHRWKQNVKIDCSSENEAVFCAPGLSPYCGPENMMICL